MSATRREHWEAVYGARASDAVSWYQAEAGPSLALLAELGVGPGASVLDVGGGASTLVDGLLAAGHDDVTVLDVSEHALAAARARLGARATQVTWLAADITTVEFGRAWDVWHDRAVFHFLTEAADRAGYRTRLHGALAPGGVAVVATFAADGPERCSGLPVCRYAPDELAAALDLVLVASRRELHRTPAGGAQAFTWVALRRSPPG